MNFSSLGASDTVTWPLEPAPRASRLLLLDGVRGYLLYMMVVAHFSFVVSTPLFLLHVGHWSPIFDAEFFIPMSGFVCALAYYGPFMRDGLSNSVVLILRRVRWLYLYQVAATLAVIALVKVFGPINSEVSREVAATPLLSLLLRVPGLGLQPTYLDILPLYMLFMPLIPVALWVLTRGQTAMYFGGLAALWLVAAAGVDARLLDACWPVLGPVVHYVRPMGDFNPLSYAALFYVGLYLGYCFKVDGFTRFKERCVPLRGIWAAFAVIVCLAFAAAELVRRLTPLPLWSYDRVGGTVTLPGMASTIAIAYLVYFLLAKQPGKVGRLAARGLRWLFSRPLLVTTGQMSLFVYSAHVVVVWCAFAVVEHLGQGVGMVAANAALLLSMATVGVLAYLKRRHFPQLP